MLLPPGGLEDEKTKSIVIRMSAVRFRSRSNLQAGYPSTEDQL